MLKTPQMRAAEAAKAEQDEAPPPRMPRFGLALFADPAYPADGWACLSGGRPVRFHQPAELANDCIWITSLDSMEFSRRLSKMHNLRPSDYFSKLKHICADMGIRVDANGIPHYSDHESIEILAELMHRTAMVAVQVYACPDPHLLFKENSLHEDIRRMLVQPPAVRSYMKPHLLSAYQTYSSPDWTSEGFETDVITVTLRLNRLEHACKVMATPVPQGPWTYVDSGLALEAALDPNAPSLVEAAIETRDIDPSLSALVAFGAQPGRRNGLRSWMCQRELAWISKYVKVHITRAYRCLGSAELPVRLRLPELLVSDPLFMLSISHGMVAESHWNAIASPTYNARSQAQEKREVSPWAVWLRAADRALSFELALAAHKAGFHVFGYGNGSIVVRLQRPRLPELLEFAVANEVAHPSFREIFEQNGILEPA